MGKGQVLSDMTEAKNILSRLKGSRLRIFSEYSDALLFAEKPIEDHVHKVPASLSGDMESFPFDYVPRGTFTKFKIAIEEDDSNSIRSLIDDNPLVLVTLSDTPTLLQVRLRYNALHVAAANGSHKATRIILEYLNSVVFWRRLYPYTDIQCAISKQLHVTDLYLNSPELGNFETPLHFASKFGNLNCAQLMASHPRVQLNAVNKYGQTANQIALSRVCNKEPRETGLAFLTNGFDSLGLSEQLDRIINAQLLSRAFKTSWLEFWYFLDDFADLGCDSGLKLFEQYLSDNSHFPTEANSQTGSLFTDAASLDGLPTTPIMRQRRRIAQEPSSPNEPVSDPTKWSTYRDDTRTTDLLDTSLNTSSDNSSSSSSSAECGESASGGVSTNGNNASPLKPVMNLLRRLTFASPIQWLVTNPFKNQEPRPHHQVRAASPSKKPSPLKRKRSHSLLHHLSMPANSVQIHRALPNGDPEIELVVEKLRSAQPCLIPNRLRIPLSAWFNPTDLTDEYPHIVSWRSQVESNQRSNQ